MVVGLDYIRLRQTVSTDQLEAMPTDSGWTYTVKPPVGQMPHRRLVRCAPYQNLQLFAWTLDDGKHDAVWQFKVDGSLPKYLVGDNTKLIPLADVPTAVSDLLQKFGLTPDVAEVTSSEIGTDWATGNAKPRELINGLIAIDTETFVSKFKGNYAQCKRTKYLLKVYGKAEQLYKTKSESTVASDVLRIELRAETNFYRVRKVNIKRAIDLTNPEVLAAMERVFISILERCTWWAISNCNARPQPMAPESAREKWSLLKSHQRKQIKLKQRKWEVANRLEYPISKVTAELRKMSQFSTYDNREDRDIRYPVHWTRLAVLKWFEIDPLRATPQMIERHANRLCVICGRKLKGDAETTCQRPAPCRNAKSNPVHDVCKAIAKQLNEQPHIAELLTNATIQQRIDNRLRMSHFRYRPPAPTEVMKGLSLF